MKTEAQRIAIAEACGWKPPGHPDREKVCDTGCSGIAAGDLRFIADANDWWLDPNGSMSAISCAPDYLTDLNAMHEAEKVLTRGEYAAYCSRLADLFSRACGYEWDDGYVGAIAATASRRAEAFLRTLNLWTD